MAKRINDASEKFAGAEPTFDQEKELSKLDLIVALNWYNSMRDSKHAKKYLVDALKHADVEKNVIAAFSEIADTDCRTIGFVARMINRGAKLSEADREQFDNGLTGLIVAAETIAEEKKNPMNAEAVESRPQVSIQDRIRIQANKVIGELEGRFDTVDANVRPLLVDAGVKGPQAKHILEWVEAKRDEYTKISRSKDEQVKEAYSHLSKKDYKEIFKWFDGVEADINAIVAAKKAARKPRARKEKPLLVQVGAVKYLKADPSLKANSVDPTQIIGALQLWVFNVKTRKLGVFNACDDSGLKVKGTTVKNFDESKSFAKTIRKPEVKIPELIAAGKVALRKFMDGIKAKESTLKGRLNEDTLLLKVVK